MLGDIPQEALPVLLQQVLRQVLVRSIRHLRSQGRVPVLQQLEDKGGQAQVPLNKTLRALLFVVWISSNSLSPPIYRLTEIFQK